MRSKVARAAIIEIQLLERIFQLKFIGFLSRISVRKLSANSQSVKRTYPYRGQQKQSAQSPR